MSTREPQKTFSPPMVGGSSLLIIFAVLCLTVFTLLALGTVQADCRLSEASLQAVTDYYAADLQAETIFAQLRAGEIPQGVLQQDTDSTDRLRDTSLAAGTIYTYSCPISDTQVLMVELHWDQDQWTVLRWQAVSTVIY